MLDNALLEDLLGEASKACGANLVVSRYVAAGLSRRTRLAVGNWDRSTLRCQGKRPYDGLRSDCASWQRNADASRIGN